MCSHILLIFLLKRNLAICNKLKVFYKLNQIFIYVCPLFITTMRLKNKFIWILIILLFSILTIYSFSKTNSNIGMHHSAYWADAAGYYIYLPATFIHGYYIHNYPDNVDANMGYGFWLDKEKNKMVSKYTVGLAILTMPFFLIFHFLALIFGFTPDGFSDIYYYMPAVTGPFFLVMGAFFLFKFLRFYVEDLPAIISIFVIIFGTNILYFSTVSPFMTHVYSFAVFSFLLYSLKEYILSEYNSFKFLMCISIALALIFLLRPTNLLIALVIPFLDINSFADLKTRLILFFKPHRILIFLLIFILCISPQFVYWKFISGSFFFYTYGNEGFSNFSNPKILEVLFAPLNGMLIYNPVILLFFISIGVAIIKKRLNALLFFLIIVLAIYMISSWECFYYGCGYACRPFIEFLSLCALPFAYLISQLRKKISLLTLCVSLYLIYFNISLIFNVFSATRCFLGEHWDRPQYVHGEENHLLLWNWHEYKNYVDRAKIFPFRNHQYTWKNDFEPDFRDYFLNENKNTLKYDHAPSGQFVTSTNKEFSDGFYFVKGYLLTMYYIGRIDVSANVLRTENDYKSSMVCQINLNDSTVFWASKDMWTYSKTDKSGWKKIHHSFEVPVIHPDAKYSIYFWSPDKHNVLIDDLEVTFHY